MMAYKIAVRSETEHAQHATRVSQSLTKILKLTGLERRHTAPFAASGRVPARARQMKPG